MRVAVTGGTGVVGAHVVALARERGHTVVVLSRAAGVDLTTGADPAERLRGADTVVDVSGTRAQRRRAARAFFGAVTGQMLAAGARAGVAHHVTLSIVGIDRVDTGYYAGKRHQEERVAAGPVPWTVLRTTQFHELAEQSLGFAALGPVSLVPVMRVRPVAAAEVAAALVELAEGPPAGRVPDLAGPQEHDLVDLARRVGAGRQVVGVPLPGAAGRAVRSGGLLPDTEGPRGGTTFAEWVAAR